MIQVYFRRDLDTDGEFEVCKKYFPGTFDCRTSLTTGSSYRYPGVVLCRYSALPFNKELERDLYNKLLRPINSSAEHSYIADMNWLEDLDGLTFPTWYRISDVPESAFPVIVKGRTNSRKFEWDTKMFAKDRKAAVNIMCELFNDPLIGPQGVVFRQYVPLKTYEIGVNGLPMTNEWRCFFYGDCMVDYGFYWSIMDDLSEREFSSDGMHAAYVAARLVAKHATFFVIDVAQGEDGKWWVVEVNDGQMSGLSTIPVERFYRNLSNLINIDELTKERK